MPSQVLASEEDEERGLYLRLGAGVQWPQTQRLRDQDCGSQQPPALFGCGSGEDGQPLSAMGAFRRSPMVDAALGYRWTHGCARRHWSTGLRSWIGMAIPIFLALDPISP